MEQLDFFIFEKGMRMKGWEGTTSLCAARTMFTLALVTQLLPRWSLAIIRVRLGGVPRNPDSTTWHWTARLSDRAWNLQVDSLKYLWCHNRPSLVSTDLSCRDGIQATIELAIFARPSDVSQEDRGSSQELAETCQGQRIIRTKKD